MCAAARVPPVFPMLINSWSVLPRRRVRRARVARVHRVGEGAQLQQREERRRVRDLRAELRRIARNCAELRAISRACDSHRATRTWSSTFRWNSMFRMLISLIRKDDPSRCCSIFFSVCSSNEDSTRQQTAQTAAEKMTGGESARSPAASCRAP